MNEGFHPGIDDTLMCPEEASAKYRLIIGYCIWIIVLESFDIAYAMSSKSRFNISPREGYLKAAKKNLAFLNPFPKGKIIVDTT
jgi:hypothetical protein